ncbi:hypothetical protein F5882DRAFT_461726 [Hyaloscypha sp. PMI_1271]|nr:hypothetical protein F5882DRAFT_461726 [Hyaloscypha sp. PMI_1271]
MRVLLLGATGNLGSRCLPALIAHKHVVTVFVRNSSKLRAMVSPALLAQANAIVEEDATDSTALKKAILDHDIEGIIDVAGNIVPPWKESLLPKIASAVRDAAVAVGKQRGKPLRAWITSHLGILEYSGTSYLIQDFVPNFAIAVTRMVPLDPKQGLFEPINASQSHDLLVGATAPPAWESTWLGSVPLIGPPLNAIYVCLVLYPTKYEAVADLLAEDLEKENSEWIGKKVGMKEKRRKDI